MNMITEQELHPSLKLKINSKASQYEDFTKQKGQKNGIAELDDEGKVKKEQLPKMNNGTILGTDGYHYRPLMEKRKMIMTNYLSGDAFERVLMITEKYIYSLNDNYNVCRYDKNTGKNVIHSNDRFSSDTSKCIMDQNYLYIISNDKIYKLDKENLKTISSHNISGAHFLFINSMFLYCYSKKIYIK